MRVLRACVSVSLALGAAGGCATGWAPSRAPAPGAGCLGHASRRGLQCTESAAQRRGEPARERHTGPRAEAGPGIWRPMQYCKRYKKCGGREGGREQQRPRLAQLLFYSKEAGAWGRSTQYAARTAQHRSHLQARIRTRAARKCKCADAPLIDDTQSQSTVNTNHALQTRGCTRTGANFTLDAPRPHFHTRAA